MIKCSPSNLYLNLLSSEDDSKTDTINGTKNGTINGTINSFESLSEIEQKIIETLFKKPNATQDYISTSLNTPLRTIKRCMSILQSQNILQRIGSNRKGYWIINK